MTEPGKPKRKIFLIATEASGDNLGGPLIRELRARLGEGVTFEGIGGPRMEAAGLASLFPIGELAIVGLVGVARQLPMLLGRIRQATDAVLRANPDVLIIIDSPDFTHRVARRVRKRNPAIPIVDYVSPTVWAWRPGRAQAMTKYIDHVLALLPFEPDAHRELGGPPCTYVGHPLIEQLDTLRPNDDERRRREAKPPVLLLLPGSRRGEIRNHMQVFGETLAALEAKGIEVEAVLPTTPHLLPQVEAAMQDWKLRPRIVTGEADKRAAFRIAHAALAKSGTVTLELALAGVPMVTLYRGTQFEAFVARRVVRVPSVILANLVLGENAVPEYLQDDCRVEKLLPALQDILADTPVRRRQIEAFGKLDRIMGVGAQSPSQRAADIVIAAMK
ncbi:MAG: lipid-A-disaccharide synthase [Bradyrhizobiaceae bacterium]|nr:MAG: lipid-A-disaccharide synthase [Bradyrhizobiaceae bacterium]